MWSSSRSGRSIPWYPLDSRLGGSQSRSGRGGKEKNSQSLPGLEPPIIKPVAQYYTTELSRLLLSTGTTILYSQFPRFIQTDDEILLRLRIFSSPPRPDRLWGPPSLLPKGTGGSFPGGKAAEVWIWPLHLNLVSRSGMCGTIPPFLKTPSCRGAQLKHRDNFTFTLPILA
jgi:hypothetical protein